MDSFLRKTATWTGIRWIVLGAFLFGTWGCERDVSYPSKTVSVICPWAAGGGTDRVSRFFAAELQEAYGKPFVVVNKTGGSGAVGHSAGARAKADGHTLQMATFELSTMHWMGISDLTWENYEWLLQVNADPAAILVKADSSWSDIGSFVDAVRNSPGKVKMSGTATGGAWDLARAGMMLAAGLKVSDAIWVPTKGSAPSIVELLGGHIDAVCCSVPEAAAQIEAGQLKVLAVMSDERIPEYPDFPTLKESGVEWSAVGWRGFGLPKSTPPERVADLMGRLEAIAESDAYREFMKKNGFGITIRKGEDFKAFLQAQDAQWKTVIEKAGFAKS